MNHEKQQKWAREITIPGNWRAHVGRLYSYDYKEGVEPWNFMLVARDKKEGEDPIMYRRHGHRWFDKEFEKLTKKQIQDKLKECLALINNELIQLGHPEEVAKV